MSESKWRAVHDQHDAIDAYWAATNMREHQAAHHEILLFGGPDGYCLAKNRWRSEVARKLRQFALWIEAA